MAGLPNSIGFESQHCGFTSRDLDAVKKFYTEVLGFAEEPVAGPFKSVVVRTGPTSTLGFTLAAEPASLAMTHEATIFFGVDDVDACYQRLSERGVKFEGPPEEKPYGYRVVATHDPDGRRILFASATARVDETPDVAFPSS